MVKINLDKVAGVTGKANKNISHGVGRRKSSVARVWLSKGNGTLTVNDKAYLTYFDTEMAQLDAAVPFRVCPAAGQYNVVAYVQGGGLHSQANAVKLATARALVEIDETLRPLLRKHELLTVDSRLKERKKYGQKAARRKFQFVKR
ncbi:MAG: 30S ribosomal protein S9 [Candidatus Dependentiae bacterium]|nr:30S ribosomal protein S9 [Candidatus Dependentiae bacterium]